jgi:hypothetical protein
VLTVRDVSKLFTGTRAERIARACARLKEAGVSTFSAEDMKKPIMAGRGNDPCNRRSDFSAAWFKEFFPW